MEHLLLALVSFVRSHLRLYHPPSVHHSYKAIFCTWKSLVSWIQDIISRDRNAILFYRYLFRGRPIPRKHDPYPGIHFSGIETSASGWDQEFAWFETFSKDFRSFGPLPGYSPSLIVEAGSLKTWRSATLAVGKGYSFNRVKFGE